jgi:hypothetical protein
MLSTRAFSRSCANINGAGLAQPGSPPNTWTAQNQGWRPLERDQHALTSAKSPKDDAMSLLRHPMTTAEGFVDQSGNWKRLG